MTTETALSAKIAKEIANFRKTADELRLLSSVSKDLRSYKKLLKHKKFD
jgi:hypothetical protein